MRDQAVHCTTSAALAPGPGSESERGSFIGRLAPPFARLYHSSTDVERVLLDAGLERLRGWLKVNDEAVIVWYRVLGRVSERDEDLEAVIGVARRGSPMTLVCSAPGGERTDQTGRVRRRSARDDCTCLGIDRGGGAGGRQARRPRRTVGLLAPEVAEVNRAAVPGRSSSSVTQVSARRAWRAWR